jgi:hypothetical protein
VTVTVTSFLSSEPSGDGGSEWSAGFPTVVGCYCVLACGCGMGVVSFGEVVRFGVVLG